MDRYQPSTSTAFNKLPIELNKAIAHYIENDQDLGHYRLVCRSTHDAVDGDHLSFWRARFREKYAFKAGPSNQDFKEMYQKRTKYLKWGISEDFKQQGNGKVERRIIRILRDLIIESFQGTQEWDQYGRPRCPNQVALIKFILNARSFLAVKPSVPTSPRSEGYLEPNPELAAVQIMCAQLLLELNESSYDILAFDDSQKVVYASKQTVPLFSYPSGRDAEVNMDWTLHCLNFFRHHMVKKEMHSLYETMANMEIGEKPSAWRDPFKAGCYPLSNYWKGTYAYLEPGELDKIRKLSSRKGRYVDDYFFEDKNVELGGRIQELELDFVNADELTWPETFEARLQSHTPTMDPRTRAQRRAPKSPDNTKSIRLTGQGIDQDDLFFASGWLNPLAPQCGIPGWQRVTFMKHFDQDYDQVLTDDLWAYEGVVLPGGRLMLGRWWFASDEPSHRNYGNYSGPFILWAVDSPPKFSDDEED